MAVPALFEDVCIIDADTHLTEPHDLWTSRAPAAFRERLPQVVVDENGTPLWVVDGVVVGKAGGAAVVKADGSKVFGTQFFGLNIEDVHAGAYSAVDRVATMDDWGIWAQVIYPNTFGLGGQTFAKLPDPEIRLLTVTIFNDAMAEMQDSSGGRLVPMGALPWWDVKEAVAEVERVHALGLRGINTTTAPHQHGLPDLGEPYWNPLWEVCSSLEMPVNFHIGAAESDIAWFGTVGWPSLGMDQKLAVGSSMLYLNNAACLANMIFSGVLERFPTLQIVSVESGVGWFPFIMQALDHQAGELPPGTLDYLSLPPSEYFKRQIHACFWFERTGLDQAIDTLGADHIMFETDYPHPTCTYPNGLDLAAEALSRIPDSDVRRKLMGGNAARLYRIDPPGPVSATHFRGSRPHS
jgi:predicted TIM-barrel fold metal-dependent hydrolase